jgi:hypothetical protein
MGPGLFAEDVLDSPLNLPCGGWFELTVASLMCAVPRMPGLLPNVDPEGLLEFSVVYSDRALNHM